MRAMRLGFGLSVLALLGGCGAKPPVVSRLPASAVLEGAAQGWMTTRITESGTLYIVDTTKNELIYTTPIRANQSVQLDARDGVILIDSRQIEIASLRVEDQYALYVDPMPGSASGVSGG